MFCFAAIVYAKPVPSAPPFDHSKTRFQLRDIHTTLKCEQCHVDGIFKNTPLDCAGCHSTGSRVGAKPKPVNHVRTNNACDTCHTSPTSFLVKSYNHAGISGDCASCHNGQSIGVVSKSARHFPTSLPCESCHTNTSTFTSWRMNHSGISSGCKLCHGDSQIYPGVVSKPVTHIATNGAACETCHSSTTTFGGATFDHSSTTVANVCNTCHLGQFAGVTTQSAVHIPTGGAQCDTCHSTSNTASFNTFLGGNYDHVGPPTAPGRCSSCHSGSLLGARGKPATHLATTQQCDACHTQTNTSNYTTFLGATYTHTTPPGTCATCHNGTTALGKSSTHVATTAACDVCHTNTANYTTFAGARYVHPTPPGVCATCHNGTTALGKSSNHLPTTAACDTCHTQTNTQNYTTFFGASFPHTAPIAACSTCHNGTLALGKPASHILTSAECDKCHTATNTGNYATFLGAVFIHTTPIGICANCHNGTTATGKPVFHIAYSNPPYTGCDSCHTAANTNNYTTFFGATFTHQAISQACSVCHDGTTAKGKSATHVPTTAACDTCHTQVNTANYTTFLGASYTHNTPPGICASCHNNTTALGKPATHVPTSAACDSCHTQANTSNYTTFKGGSYTHASPPGVCSTCHNGTTAIGKSATHVATSAACDTCHTNTANYTTFLGASYTHTTPPATCTNCHNGATALGKPAIHVTTTAACDVCHTQANTGNYTSFLGATFTHSTPPGVCSTCHNGTIALGKSGSHIATTAECDNCHTQQNTANYTTFLGAVTHTASMAGQCHTCHNGSAAKGVSAGHIPVAGLSCDAGGCHKIYGGAVTTFGGAIMSHAVVTATRCDVCHNGSYTAQGNLGALGKITNHIPTAITGTLDCTTCHTAPVYTSATGWSSERMNHNGAQGGGPVYCVTCHLKGVTYVGSMEKKSHEGASTSKDCSSSGCHRPKGSRGTAYSKW
ncbi:MAG: hypothetical protein HZB47_07250 [Nitrosomonadales bacterium]|nr:hypothetical protein [Nitrosomonadales bacterium]